MSPTVMAIVSGRKKPVRNSRLQRVAGAFMLAAAGILPAAADERVQFADGNRLVEGWRFIAVGRKCLPALNFSWPQDMVPCALENAGIGRFIAPEPHAGHDVAARVEEATPDTDDPEAGYPPKVAETAFEDMDSFTDERDGYVLYRNARYGTVISYPRDIFSALPPPGNGDGRTFESFDGMAHFHVFAQFNAHGLSQDEMLDEDKARDWRDEITYERSGRGWYVISGYAGDDIFYRKVIIEPTDLVHVFEVVYPSAMRAQMDRAVTSMSRSFGSASP